MKLSAANDKKRYDVYFSGTDFFPSKTKASAIKKTRALLRPLLNNLEILEITPTTITKGDFTVSFLGAKKVIAMNALEAIKKFKTKHPLPDIARLRIFTNIPEKNYFVFYTAALDIKDASTASDAEDKTKQALTKLGIACKEARTVDWGPKRKAPFIVKFKGACKVKANTKRSAYKIAYEKLVHIRGIYATITVWVFPEGRVPKKLRKYNL